MAVHDITLSFEKGHFYSIVGESGSGKTTLAKLLCGIISPSSGTIVLNDKDITPPARRKDISISKNIQMVLQDGKSALDPRFTIYQSIAEPIRNLLKLPKKDEKEKIVSLIEKMELPLSVMDKRPSELSGGQLKRVCMARALATEPEIVIFDEAVSGLDVLVRKSILDLIKNLHDQTGACYIMITHDIDIAFYLSDHIIVMKDGAVIEYRDYSGDTGVFTHPYTRLLIEQHDPLDKKTDSTGNTADLI